MNGQGIEAAHAATNLPASAAAVPAWWRPVAAPSPFEVWRIDLRHEATADERAALDAEEEARAARFAFETLRRRHRAAHIALRELLARREGGSAAALRFARGPQGKPRRIGPAGVPAFNLSDSDDVALIAIAADGEIGIDVECLRPIDDAIELAALHFCPREAAWLGEAGEGDRAFLRVWVAKEACLKAIGSGLSIAAASFDGGLGDSGDTAVAWRRVVVPTPQGPAPVEWRELDAGPDCVAALARRLHA